MLSGILHTADDVNKELKEVWGVNNSLTINLSQSKFQ